MQSLEGKRVLITLDKETLELETSYRKQQEGFVQSRAEIIRTLYNQFLKTVVVREEE
jgi:hypothetical protein